MKSLSLRIPASSGNLGAGFDSLGLAFAVYNSFDFVWQEEYQLSYTHPQNELLDPTRNYVINSYEFACAKLGKKSLPFALHCDNQIPFASGFGSSGTAALAGCAAALLYHTGKLDQSQLLQLACELEEHPDNVAASLYGGFVISCYDKEKGSWAYNFPISTTLSYWVILPKLQTYTQAARKNIPSSIERSAVVFNLSHAALTAAAYVKQDYQLLKSAVDDQIHEQRRDMPQLDYQGLKRKLLITNVFSVSLCGSGPAILVLAPEINNFQKKLVGDHFARLSVEWHDSQLKADNQGMTFTYE